MDVASGLLLGIVYVATPGPIGVETLRQGMKGGFGASLAVQAGSVIGLAVYALLALLGAGLLLQHVVWQMAIGVCGTAVLLYLGLTTIRDGGRLVVQPETHRPDAVSPQRAFSAGTFLSLANPLEILFWLALANRVLHDPDLNGPAFLTSFFVGCVLASLGTVGLACVWRSRLTTRTARGISWACGLALIAFGVRLAFTVGRLAITP